VSREENLYVRMVNSVRIALEQAGNPAYVLLIESGGEIAVEPMIYAALRPAAGHAARAVSGCEPGERVFIISRAVEGQRVAFTIMDDQTRKLHQQFEVIEKSISEADPPV